MGFPSSRASPLFALLFFALPLCSCLPSFHVSPLFVPPLFSGLPSSCFPSFRTCRISLPAHFWPRHLSKIISVFCIKRHLLIFSKLEIMSVVYTLDRWHNIWLRIVEGELVWVTDFRCDRWREQWNYIISFIQQSSRSRIVNSWVGW